MQASLGRVKTNTSTKTALSLPISHVCLSVTSESWKESLSYSFSREKSLVVLDAPAHPILQCAFPEASTTNHKSAGIALSYGDGITISVRPIDLCEDSCQAKGNKVQLAYSAILPFTKKIKQKPCRTGPQTRNAKHDPSISLFILTSPTIW